MIKNRLRNLVIFLITTSLILILNSSISFSQDTDTQNDQHPCQKSDSCVFLDNQFLFGIYADVGDVTARERANIVNKTIDSIANNLLTDTNQIFTSKSDTCSTDKNDVQTCDAILAYISSDGESQNIRNIIQFNQDDVAQTKTQEGSQIKSPIDLANKYKKNIKIKINLYRSVLRDGRGNPFLTGILLFTCFILIFHQLFLNQIYNFFRSIVDCIADLQSSNREEK